MPVRTRSPLRAAIGGAVIALASAGPLAAQAALSPATRAQIDSAARIVLAATGAPSVSIAVVRNGTIVYTNAYGLARLEPQAPAMPSMRYSIGSISKQFTATASTNWRSLSQ